MKPGDSHAALSDYLARRQPVLGLEMLVIAGRPGDIEPFCRDVIPSVCSGPKITLIWIESIQLEKPDEIR